MPPDLVIANAAYKVYPGGVIALRASDWMAGARGTLSSETDARAIAGEAVRDTQQVTTSLRTDAVGAFQEAADSLEIDLSLIPMEIGMPYRLWFSILIEGDLDPTDLDSRYAATNLEHSFACGFGWYGDASHATDANPAVLFSLPRLREHYTIHDSSSTADIVGNEVIYVRAYSYTASTTEWLLDQVFLVPYVTGGTHASEWRASDFVRLGQGDTDTFTSPGVIDDGADGGDSYGKFTWYGSSDETRSGATDDGGDFQRVANYAAAEYTMLWPWDFAFARLENSETGATASAHGYSVVGSNYRPVQSFLADDFSRTVAANDWGVSADGVGYALNTVAGGDCSVDGSEGVITSIQTTPLVYPIVSLHRTPGIPGLNAGTIGVDMELASFSWTGQVRAATPVYDGSGTQSAVVNIGIGTLGASRCWTVSLDALGSTWRLALGNTKATSAYGGTEGDTTYLMHGDVDISGWFAYDSPVGFRIERKRYLLRVRVWDATGAEPGTWDFEDYIPITTNLSGSMSGVIKDYSYADDFDWAHNTVAQSNVFPWVNQTWANTNAGWTTHWDDFAIDYDPEGDPASVYSGMETPIGTKVSEIEIPYGAYQMIYWGQRLWTIVDGFGDNWLEFAARNWNDTGAALLQRAEATGYYFRSNHVFIIPMNWRSSTREGGWKRILKGNS